MTLRWFLGSSSFSQSGRMKTIVGSEIGVDLAIVDAKAPLRALADVSLQTPDGKITIRRCAVFQRSGEPPWASLPRLLVKKNGKQQFFPLIDLPRELKVRVQDALLVEYRVKTRKH